MTSYDFEFYMTKTERLFSSRASAKLLVCLVQNVYNNGNNPIRRYQLADITGVNAHTIATVMDQLLKTGVVLRVGIGGTKLGYKLDMQNPVAVAMARFVQAAEGQTVPLLGSKM